MAKFLLDCKTSGRDSWCIKNRLYLKTAILMAVSTDCTLAGAKSWLEEERPYIRALNAAV